MTNQIPAENTLSIEEVRAAFAKSYGGLVGQLTLQNLSLEKQVQSLQSRLSDVEEIAFGLKRDNANLIKSQVTLEAEIAALIKAGPTADQIAAQGKAVIDGVTTDTEKINKYEDTETIASFAAANYGKEKAAPVEAA